MKLWAHQKKSLEILEANERTFDSSDPGTGKTFVALTAFKKRRKSGNGCMLVLAPKSLLQPAWGNDITKFFPEIRYSIANANNRAEAFQESADIYITNIDATKWLAKQPPEFFEKFDTLCIDEISYYKHRTSARSKAVNKIKKYFTYRHGMTGTPNSNSITDIWHQMYIIDDGERLGNNFFAFRNTVCTPKQVGPSPRMVKWEDKDDIEGAVASLIGDITTRNVFEECMDIPPNHTYAVPYILPKRNLEQYNQLQKDAILQLSTGSVNAINEAVLRNKLLQVAAGVVYGQQETHILDTARSELVLDLIQKRKHSVVFFNWTHQKEQLMLEANKRGVTYEVIDGTVSNKRRTEIVEAYQAGFYDTIFLHPRTGAHGLTLTTGTATIWVSPIYEADFLKQGMHRIYRGGQTLPTETILIEAVDTVESKVYSILNKKQTRMSNLLSLLER